MSKKLTFLILILVALFSTPMISQSLDWTFGNNGFKALSSNNFHNLFQTSAGKILVHYTSNDTINLDSTFLTRLNIDGSIDMTYGNQGSITLHKHIGSPYGVNLLTSNGILLSDESFLTSNGTQIMKITPNGAIDMTFGNNGYLDINMDFTSFEGQIKIQKWGNNQIMAFGHKKSSNPLLSQTSMLLYNMDFTPSTSFNNGLEYLFNQVNQPVFEELARGVFRSSTGQVRVLAEHPIADAIVTLNNDGTRSNINSITGGGFSVISPYILSNDNQLLAGFFVPPNLSNNFQSFNSYVYLDEDGSGFGGSIGGVRHIWTFSDNSHLLASYGNDYNGLYKTKVNSFSTLDSTFSINGQYLNPNYSHYQKILIQNNDKIIVAVNGGLIRLTNTSTNTNEPTKTDFNVQVHPNPVLSSNVQLQYTIEKSGKMETSLFGMDGRHIAIFPTISRVSGTYNQILELPKNLATGIYFLKIQFDNQVITRKIIIQ